MRKIFRLACFAFFVSVFFADINAASFSDSGEASWKIFQRAEVEFDSGNYGRALELANSAKAARNDESLYDYQTIDTAISVRQVIRAGDSFSGVISVLSERDEKNAVNIINKYLEKYGIEYFSDSVQNMLSWIKERAVYPEADYLIGKIYQLEGEYDTALSFYEKARVNADYLDIPDQLTDVLYSMAYIARLKNNPENYEQLLLLIINNDSSFKNQILLSSLLRTVDSDSAANVDKFFLLYRSDNIRSVRALYLLSELYSSIGEEELALKYTALAAVETFTHIFDTICERESAYKYTTFADFLDKCSEHDDIIRWGQNNYAWEIFFMFAQRCDLRGKTAFAEKLYFDMAEKMPDLYYKTISQNKISKQ